MINWINRLSDYITEKIVVKNNGSMIKDQTKEEWENLRKDFDYLRKEGIKLINEDISDIK